MCRQTITKHTVCGHEENDSFPCEVSIDTGSCPQSEPTFKEEPTYCSECTHFADAMKKIETDASLAAVPRTIKDPSAPKRYAKTREHYEHCGHYDKVIQQDFELGEDDPDFITEEMIGSCHGCSQALPWQIEEMKQYGRWTDDPWGAMDNVRIAEEEKNNGWDSGPSSQPASAAASGCTAPGLDQDAGSDDDLESIDYTPEKNKGVAGRPPPSHDTASSYYSDNGDSSDNEEGHHPIKSYGSHPLHDGYSGDIISMDGNSEHEDNGEHPRFGSEVPELPIPDWSSRGWNIPGGDGDEPVELSAEERQKMGIPLTMPLTKARLASLLRRRMTRRMKQ
ncbi:hypothetical protein MMC13_002866 [Lambiella insularis]|nr:hypothetical protein [Lambiella insularis]